MANRMLKCGIRPLRLKTFFFAVLVGSTILGLYFHFYFWTTPREQTVREEPGLIHPIRVVVPLKVVTGKTKHTSEQTTSRVKDVKCVHPKLDPFDPAVVQYYQKVGPVTCGSAMKEWVYVTNGTFRISLDAIKLHGDIVCDYAPIHRNGDFHVKYGPSIKPMLSGTPLTEDFFRATCESSSGKKYTNIHAAVARNAAVMERVHKYHSQDSKNAQNTQTDESSLSQSVSKHNLSVFMFGFDSVSHMTFIRLLPKARKYYLDTLGGIELESYNILGDGTPAALLPILTGQQEEELPEARRGYKGAKPVDNHPWIWRDFSKRGYVTAWAEDQSSIGTFHYRMLGFKDPPTDHFMRPFQMMVERNYNNHPRLCLGSTPRHTVFMNWFKDLFDMYKDFPKFFFGFYSELSHNANNPLQSLDDDLITFLQDLERKGHLNSTILLLMADHGARYNFIRATAQGRLEERMPYFSFRFPPWFHKLYPNIMRNIRTNVNRLTTPYDIHATFHDILNYSSTNVGDLKNRAISLFKEIPKERTCTHSEVTTHWCACLDWQDIDQSDPMVIKAVDAAIQTINGYTKTKRSRCAELKLLEITKSIRYVPSESDRAAEWVLLKYANKPPPPVVELYQVSFKTSPGEGHFEVTCTWDTKTKSFSVNGKEISRINKYGSQAACVQKAQPHLRPYCYCTV
ncbi:hypothetical protein ACOMHN_053041 [Nucella lapillus]